MLYVRAPLPVTLDGKRPAVSNIVERVVVIAGPTTVLLVSVSVPAKVASVPVVGSVTFVAPVEVRVIELAPDVISEDPCASVKVAEVAGAVIVILLIVVASAIPSTGVTKVGDVERTTATVPVELVTPVPP